MTDHFDPYAGNLLTDGLGPILSRTKALITLTDLPPQPRDIECMPVEHRMRHILSLRDFHLPSKEGSDVQETIDIMIRESYRYRDPRSAPTWSVVDGDAFVQTHKNPRAPAMAAVVVGHSGTGKTQAVLRALGCYPQQVITHAKFPRLAGPHYQVTWQSVDVPASGRVADLAANLMTSWDVTMEKWIPDYPPRFTSSLAKTRRNGSQMLDEWRQVARTHFLGILHLDEVQNFFKLETLERRRKGRATLLDRELRIIEDQNLKWILSLSNTWQIPVVLSGTPDGIQALSKRLSNLQRFVSSGYHLLEPFKNGGGQSELFIKELIKHQYVIHPLSFSNELAALIIDLTAGIPRLIIAIWIAAHRIALRRKDDDLRLDDFRRAATTFLSPIAPAVAALKSNDPMQMARFEDLLPTDEFWANFLKDTQGAS